ncbi:MAG: peroxidase family protein [Phycisphaerae bacterium]
MRGRMQRYSNRCLLEAMERRELYSVVKAKVPPPPPAAPKMPAVEAIDGSGNNLNHPNFGKAGIDLIRMSRAAYGDGVSAPAGQNRPSARAVSNAIDAQTGDIVNNRNMSDIVYLFGQFLDHDIDLTDTGTTEEMDIAVPTGDPWFDPNSTGTQVIADTRSVFDAATGKSAANPRQQTNAITAFIDGSQIYGSDTTREMALRTMSGGHLKTSPGDLLPLNTLGLANANDAHIVADDQLFLAGDVRANENIELTAMQTLWMREHNRIADQLAKQNPRWTDEQLFQGARRIVIGELQAITFNEFLPALLGPYAPGAYRGYDPRVNPSIATEFSTVAFRFGHSMLDGDIARMNNDGTTIPEGDAELAQAFFNPTLLNPSLPNHEGDIDPILKGAATGDAQEIDVHVVDDVRNFLFGPPGAGGMDLAALNIQRGRDHGVANYNTLRAAYGLPRVTSFAQITSDGTLQSELKATYGNVNNIDAWVGGLAEDHLKGDSLGALFTRIIGDQFERLRDGDRFWYQNTFSGAGLNAIAHTTLAQVIERNTALTTLQGNVFFYVAPGAGTIAEGPAAPVSPVAPLPPRVKSPTSTGGSGARSGGLPSPVLRTVKGESGAGASGKKGPPAGTGGGVNTVPARGGVNLGLVRLDRLV